MVKVITYGSYDMLHYGHVRLLERAKALGDYLIVGVTSDDYDKTRGKINLQQSLMERIESVKGTGIPDEVIVEEYEGQKIDDIRKYDIDIFTVGSDWIGHFDYLNEYCKVVYLPRTEGVSSTQIRNKYRKIKLGIVGDSAFLNKISAESRFVNGVNLAGVCSSALSNLSNEICSLDIVTNDFEHLIENVDAIYLRSLPENHYKQIKEALSRGVHVLCESPVCLNPAEFDDLMKLAADRHLILMEAIKTAYSTAYSRLLLLVKSGAIGKVVSVDSRCTRLLEPSKMADTDLHAAWDGLYEWGPTALLPIFQLLGTDMIKTNTCIRKSTLDSKRTAFVKSDFVYRDAVGSILIGDGVKTEGELVITGTDGYVLVPAPWWKTDYFELRYEDPSLNRRYFYQLEGEGIRYELVSFIKAIETTKSLYTNVDLKAGRAIALYMGEILANVNVSYI